MVSGDQISDVPSVIQLGLPHLGTDLLREDPRYAGQNRTLRTASSDPALDTYFRRLTATGGARKGFEAYRYQLQTVLRLAERLAGRSVSVLECFADEELLGRALVEDTGVAGRQLSRWTLAQRRSAIRSFATLMRPELMAFTGSDPHRRLDAALQRVADRTGNGYRLTGGAPRRRGGATPSPTDIAAILAVVSTDEGFAGLRNAVFFSTLASTGARVNALRELSGSDCIEMPSGRIRLFLHEKGKHESREVELSLAESAALRAYADAFNACAVAYEWSGRVRLGSAGPVWRGVGGHCWTYREISSMLRRACEQANVLRLTPHAFRRAFASTAASVLPRHVVALAGGWRGLERLDDHYVQVAKDDLWSRLTAARKPSADADTSETLIQEPLHATT